MIKPNNPEGNSQLLGTQNTLSNTTLFLHPPLTLSTNSFKSSLPLQLDSHLFLYFLSFHLDYLRLSDTDLTRNSFEHLRDSFTSVEKSKLINKPSHPCPGIAKSKQYQTMLVSQKGIVLRYTKRAKYQGKNTRYVYDIMIDFTGSYFANLSLLEQLELIYYLNTYWKLKCHRLDVAIDDYSRKLFPVGQMIGAFLRGNNYGFKVIDDTYLDIINNKLVGTLGIGSRRSSFFTRLYTKHKYFDRWETELKQKKAQKLFDDLFNISQLEANNITLNQSILNTLADAAIGQIDFRDKSGISNLKNATKAKTERLIFWQTTLDKIHSAIENQADYNWLINSLNKS